MLLILGKIIKINMTNPQKKKKTEIIEVWTSLKEKIITLLSESRKKDELITKLEQKNLEANSNNTSTFFKAVVKEVKLMSGTPIEKPVNVNEEQLIEVLKSIRKDYWKLKGFDDNGRPSYC